MRGKRFIAIMVVILAFGLLCSNAAQYVSDGSFEDEVEGTQAKDTDKFSYDYGMNIIQGEAVIKTEGDNNYLSVTGFSEFFLYDTLEKPYTYSVDLKLDKVGDVNIFVRAGRNEGSIFPFYEWDWYNEKGGKNGTSSTGGPGLLVSLQSNAIRVRIKNMQTDSENEGICSVFYDFPAPEGYDIKKFNNIKFVDDGSKIEIYFNNQLFATAEMSDKGIYDQDKDHLPVDFTYFKKVVLKDSTGNVVLTEENARLVAESNIVAFGGRSSGFYIDNITLSYEVPDPTPTPEATATPEPTPTAQASTPTPAKTAEKKSDNKGNNTIIFIAIGGVAVVAVLGVVIFKAKKK